MKNGNDISGQEPDDIDNVLKLICKVYMSIRTANSSRAQAFPCGYAIGILDLVMAKHMKIPEIIDVAIRYGEAMSN